MNNIPQEKNLNGVYDARNKLNDLTGKEWLKLTKSFWFSEKCAADKAAMKHPAPFLIKDTEKLISFFTKRGMTVLDPFCGSGTTIIAAHNLERKCIGFDLNETYKTLAINRLDDLNIIDNYKYLLGNSLDLSKHLEKESIDYIVTSPPYHNILKNKAQGLRTDKSEKGFRNGGRIGANYYSDKPEDLGNCETYHDFLTKLKELFTYLFQALKEGRYCTIVISDFTVDKKEINVQGDIVRIMQSIGFEFVGTTILLQDNKPLYPFGYPFAYKINHNHQNMISFRRVTKT
ncbi:DNA methyltransferase [Haemophilus paracuniculus]|uniref:Methyltransferase n=1 Tax=Haemophilus paracuniculus TaxID=734 RepID=A0A1T0AR11_9PAST|nr:DNA methyltransferase [Haemophilus paracuniculus]OOR98722.1 DNA methyltransferase [Haemophilus paracuniculus]